ncbi:MAG: glycogen synthase [Candidatus Bipolaricaulota bacterium]|nr:MAG: glycogen synthase [Candidatus Bipolaricaulota bacterium]
MRVLFVSAEVSPFAKTGGLADVALALPRSLAASGIDVRVVMPKYRAVGDKTETREETRLSVPVAGAEKPCVVFSGSLPESEVPIHFLGNDPYYDRPEIYGEGAEYPDALERFTFFSRGALELCAALEWIPDLIHINDWHTGLIPGYLADHVVPGLESARTLLTIHNLGYQGEFPGDQAAIPGLSESTLEPYWHRSKLNLLKGGILRADLVNTVSPTYAEEILHEGAGLEEALRAREDSLFGVINGIDMDEWDPATDSHLWATFDKDDLAGKAENKARLQEELGLAADPAAPILGVISRLAEQKGFDLVMSAFDRMMELPVQFVLLGTGSEEYEAFFREAQTRYAGRVSSMITFSEPWAHRIEAASDMFLMPSHYEPCGLNQQYSLRYGTVPVVRATGGLRDTVHPYDSATDDGNGFLFEQPTPEAFLDAVRRAVDLFTQDPEAWDRLRRRGMAQDLSWDASAVAYRKLYEKTLESA